MNDKSSTHFTKQNIKEKESRFFQLEKQLSSITIWEKGNSSREKFTTIKFDKENMALVLSIGETIYTDKNILYAFSINGVNYFGQGLLKKSVAKTYRLLCDEDLFKSERRESYRLLTYPHYDVYVEIPFVEDENIAKSNVVNFETGVSQTGLFKNFLQIVGEEETSVKENHAKFRVLDISVSGLSFQIGEIEKEYLENKKFIKPMFLTFDEEIMIPSIEIRYIVPLIRSQGSAYKVGIQFLDIDTSLDQKLGKMITKAMRSFENDFEDFLR